jgi:hypothetical protein
MAISTSSTQIALPGFDTTQQTNMNVALNSNTTMLNLLTSSFSATNLTTQITNVNAVTTQVATLPQVEALPTIMTFSNYQNTPGYMCYDSDLQPIHGAALSTNTEIAQGYTGQNYTTGNFGSSGVTNYWVSATPFHQSDGSWLVNLPGYAADYDMPYGVNQDQVASIYARYGVVVGNYGVRQKFSLYFSDANVGMAPRGANNLNDYVNINNTTYATWYGGNGYGQIGYSQRTRTLVALESKDSANNYRLHIWRNTNANRDLNDYNASVGILHAFMSEAKAAATPTSTFMTATTAVGYTYQDFQWQQANSQNYTESRYRARVIPCDNGTIAIYRWVPSNQAHMAVFTATPQTLGSAGTLNTSFTTQAPTTTYGIDNGNQYGHRSMMTWNNYWIACYAPYYYYGCGVQVHFINTQDPTKYFLGNNNDTSNGGQLMPFKEGKFIFNQSIQNADGNVGMRLWHIDLDGWSSNLRYYDGSAISYGQNISLTNWSTLTYSFDTRYTSTNYPTLAVSNHWTNG